MLTMQDYKNMFAKDVEVGRKAKKQAMYLIHELEIVHEHALCTHGNPQKTIEEFVNKVGFEEARYCIATMVNVRAWDGRIYPRNAEWASKIADAWDEESGWQMGFHTNRIHPAHLDQLCDYMRKLDADMQNTTMSNENIVMRGA